MVDKIWYNMEELIGGSEERGINRNILECKFSYGLLCRQSQFCINRNILECKYRGKRNEPAKAKSINRNILECKCVCPGCRMGSAGLVLIETYWNVNTVVSDSINFALPY